MNEISKKPDGNIVRVAKPDPMTVINNAVAAGLSPEAISKLVDLQERMEYNKAQKAFDAAMAKFKSQCPPIKKSKQGQFGTYAPLDEIDITIRPHLKKNGLSFKFEADTKLDGDHTLITSTCVIKHKGGGMDRSSFTAPVDNRLDKGKGANQMQRYAAAKQYCNRQSLVDALGLTSTDQDLDADPIEEQLIDDEQLATLDTLLGDTGVDRDKFLKYFSKRCGREIKMLDDLPIAQYKKAVQILEAKL